MLDRVRTSTRRAARRHPAFRPFRDEIESFRPVLDRLEAAAEGTAAERRESLHAFVSLWIEAMSAHLNATELHLLPLTADPALRERALAEHRRLRSMALDAARFRSDPDPDPVWTANLAARLRARFRWEDRTWFPALERNVAIDRLGTLARDTRRHAAHHERSDA